MNIIFCAFLFCSWMLRSCYGLKCHSHLIGDKANVVKEVTCPPNQPQCLAANIELTFKDIKKIISHQYCVAVGLEYCGPKQANLYTITKDPVNKILINYMKERRLTQQTSLDQYILECVQCAEDMCNSRTSNWIPDGDVARGGNRGRPNTGSSGGTGGSGSGGGTGGSGSGGGTGGSGGGGGTGGSGGGGGTGGSGSGGSGNAGGGSGSSGKGGGTPPVGKTAIPDPIKVGGASKHFLCYLCPILVIVHTVLLLRAHSQLCQI